MTFGKTLKKLRREAGITQMELAERVGVSQAAVTAYERDIKKPEMDKVPVIAQVLGTKIEDLYGMVSKNVKGKKLPHGNKRSTKVQELFNKLKPEEQRIVLKQIQLLAGAANKGP